MHEQIIAVGTVLVLLLALTTGAAALEESEDSHIVTVDDETELTDDTAIQQFEDRGYVTADVDGLDMQLTVAEDSGDVGIDSLLPMDVDTYIQVDYNEEIARTIRFYVPEEYVQPRVKNGVESHSGEHEATYEPVDDNDYLAVTVHLDGETDAVFPVNGAFGTFVAIQDRAYSTIENATDFAIPRLGSGGGTQWQFVPEHALTGSNDTWDVPANTTDELDEMSIQYDSTPDEAEPTWRSVEGCDVDTEPVCLADRDGNPVLFSPTEDPPAIRWKGEQDLISETRSAAREVIAEWETFIEDILGGWT